ncbi:glycoside hydrolase family 95-like protein [Blautia massiliensis (ex Durand et al. 2017)]|uniref:glycoside hydrolase family 95-like protein n=1 Tax=Blautia massiliensis (ex Durand et al. 2017) TaxID=1737424 RepID=UPI003FA484BD
MLVQYQDDRIFFLPALPTEWKDGKISGLRAPGGITIDFVRKDRCITECSLRSQTDTVRTLLYNGTEKKVMLKADVICYIV